MSRAFYRNIRVSLVDIKVKTGTPMLISPNKEAIDVRAAITLEIVLTSLLKLIVV